MVVEVKEMVKVEDYEEIRRRYFIDGWSIRKISRELHRCRRTVRKAVVRAEPSPYNLREPRAKPVLGPYQSKIEQLVEENQAMPRKQRYTARKIYPGNPKGWIPGQRRKCAALRGPSEARLPQSASLFAIGVRSRG